MYFVKALILHQLLRGNNFIFISICRAKHNEMLSFACLCRLDFKAYMNFFQQMILVVALNDIIIKINNNIYLLNIRSINRILILYSLTQFVIEFFIKLYR